MYLLNPNRRSALGRDDHHLHSTMYLLNRGNPALSSLFLLNLHSTMYLLNHVPILQRVCQLRYLHSTMYLLNPDAEDNHIHGNIFTFHYVSIKSFRMHPTRFLQHKHLHSTMYLLNHAPTMLERHVNFIYIPLCIY